MEACSIFSHVIIREVPLLVLALISRNYCAHRQFNLVVRWCNNSLYFDRMYLLLDIYSGNHTYCSELSLPSLCRKQILKTWKFSCFQKMLTFLRKMRVIFWKRETIYETNFKNRNKRWNSEQISIKHRISNSNFFEKTNKFINSEHFLEKMNKIYNCKLFSEHKQNLKVRTFFWKFEQKFENPRNFSTWFSLEI